MDEQEREGEFQSSTPRLNEKDNRVSRFDFRRLFHLLPLDLRISLQYAIISIVYFLLARQIENIFADFQFLLLPSSNASLFFVASSTLLIYLLLHYRVVADVVAKQDKSPIVQTSLQKEQGFEARSNELFEKLNISQGINAKLEGMLADQTAIAIENERLYEAAEQTAIREERQRLGRDLHDSVTQALYSVVLFADATRLALAAGKQKDANENLHQVHQMARQAMADMRLLIYQLHPPLLKKEGLAAALQTRLEAVESRAGLQTEFRAKGECELPPTVTQELYQIAQEALNNVIKHAKAEHVTVDLSCTGAIFCMTISDDGIGFDVATAQESGGVGLRNITERTQQIHAILSLKSAPNQGTTVRVEV